MHRLSVPMAWSIGFTLAGEMRKEKYLESRLFGFERFKNQWKRAIKELVDELNYTMWCGKKYFYSMEVDTMATTTGNQGRGACGGERRQDGSGSGAGNQGTSRQPNKK